MLWSVHNEGWRNIKAASSLLETAREEGRMEQVKAMGKKITFFLLVLAVAASAKSLNTDQQNTAITATSDRQVRNLGV